MVQESFVPSLETRPFGTPLLEFKGTLKEYLAEDREPSESGGKKYKVITFNFIDIVVIRSVEPYAFPIATIQVSYSTAQQTKWDALATSIKKILGMGATLDDIVNKVQTWEFAPATLRVRSDDGAWANAQQPAWQLKEIAGVAAGGAVVDDGIDDHILSLLDGKDEQAFYQEFYQDEKVRAHPDLITAATNRTLVSTLVEAGRVTRDEAGIYHRQPAAQPLTTAPAAAPVAPPTVPTQPPA